MARKSLEHRFWEKVERGPRCWIWKSARSGGLSGVVYGFFWVGGKKRSEFAHRVAYALTKGPIPRGLVVMHSCDNPLCVNPEHLSVGSNSDNLMDASRKGRIARGERNGGGRKLKAVDVRSIRAIDVGSTTLSRWFGVSAHTIKAIKRRKIWRHV